MARKRKWTAILLALLLALTATGCKQSSNHDYYERAQLYLGRGDYELAGLLFSQLGEYEESADYALYCAGLAALAEGDCQLARANFELVLPFKSSDRYLTYLEALALEDEGQLDEALALWEELGSFEDSPAHAADLRSAIPAEEMAHARALMDAGRYEQARALLATMTDYADAAMMLDECDEAILRAAYDRAELLYAQGEFESAMSAFEALGDSLDAAQRARDCRAAMYEALEAAYAHASMASALALIEGYAEMEDYADSAERLAALEARFSTNLALLDSAAAWPWVSFGQYPDQENGAPEPILWRMISVDGATATLLCDSVIDALPATTLPSLMLSADEQAAVISLSLPLLTDVADLTEDDLRCAATPYALSQGVRHHSDGAAWWWLGNPLGEGRNAVVRYNGTILDAGVAATEAVIGMRPLLRVDLDKLTLTEGNGTVEEPYR